MNSIRPKVAWFLVMMLGAGFSITAPKRTIAQERGERSHSIQAAPGSNQNGSQQQEGRNGNRMDRNRNNNSQRFDNNGRWDDNNRRWNNDSGRQWNNNFAGSRDRDRDDRDRGRERDRHRGDRNRNNYSFGLYWGAPYTNYYPYDYGQGYYGQPAYGSPYDLGYSDGFSSGQFDRINGNLYNPRQYERSGDPDYFEGFVAGYEDGYRR